MKLKKALKIIKSKDFTVFVYPKGHIKEKRGLDEPYIEIFDISRNEKGKLPQAIKYADVTVREIIPHFNGVNLVIEI